MIVVRNLIPKIICLLIAISGFATLSWEVIWQLKSALALGVSAWGAAITVAITMGGMGLGGFLMGQALRSAASRQAIRLYGLLEIVAGLAGLYLNAAFGIVERVDTWAYSEFSTASVFILGLIVVLGIPALCMGATLPVFGLIAKQFQMPLARLYSLNTLGAAVGVLLVAFVVIPLFGVAHTIVCIAAMNIVIGLTACLISTPYVFSAESVEQPIIQIDSFSKIVFIVFVTGFATFALEIAWFRSLANVFSNTTDVFAIILACTLIALGLGANSSRRLKQVGSLGVALCIAGILILLVTPMLERIDNFFVYTKHFSNYITAQHTGTANINVNLLANNSRIWILLYAIQTIIKFFVIALILVLPIRYLGMAFPWVIIQHNSPKKIGNFYAVNTVAAIIGSIAAAWLLLPTIGFAKTAWIAGSLVVIAGVVIIPNPKRFLWGFLGVVALVVAMYLETGIGKTRVQGFFATDDQGNSAKVLASYEGPDETVSAIEYHDGTRTLLINSARATFESSPTYSSVVHYMAWMGRLPMLLQANPKNALVICFGTGQTANAVRKENPETLDIVDINANVFKLAPYFKSNENVLSDPRVKSIVMDGRAYIRRTTKQYDVITLEPMPPVLAGVNALYSREFYEQARKHLSQKGVIAQWLSLHSTLPYYTASIARTFTEVFPNSVLWIDSASQTGILLGTKDDSVEIAKFWPGFARSIQRDLTQAEVAQAVMLNPKELTRYGAYGKVITDDNQLLAYGKALYVSGMLDQNFELLKRVKNNGK